MYEQLPAEDVATFEACLHSQIHQSGTATTDTGAIDVFVTELAYVNHARAVLEGFGLSSLPIVVLAYPQQWRQCAQRVRLHPMFKPILHGRVICILHKWHL